MRCLIQQPSRLLNVLERKRIDVKWRSQFIPACDEVKEDDLFKFQRFLERHKKLFILTGAGISTESGIPDYRSEGVGRYATSNRRPLQYSDFLKSASIRQRYWARNYTGWPRFSSHQPNRTHYILSDWEKRGRVHWLVTQNVDSLHYKAGSHRLTELHGSAHRVVCLSCYVRLSRSDMQEMIKAENPNWAAEALSIRPDGDVELDPSKVEQFKVPPCPGCGGILKPEITFFGDNVPKSTVHDTLDKMLQSDAVVVIGSSLEVFSGYRFVIRANEYGKKIVIINIGSTRGDKLAHLKINGNCGDVLQRIKIS